MLVDHDDMNHCRLVYGIPTINHGCNKARVILLGQKPALPLRCDAKGTT